MAFNAASLYKNTSIQTASPEDLVLMLFEGAIKFSNRAIIGLEKNDYTVVNENLIKTQKIINELISSLNPQYPVSKEFEKVYRMIHSLLVEANVKKDVNLIEQALEYIREMRDTWKQVMEIANNRKR